ncbi:MAG TPA: hypothetical protein DCG12_00990 [Planctomycetaceae bacterium]|nr:hypothetical protein [Planctomycetaceae bacterium]
MFWWASAREPNGRRFGSSQCGTFTITFVTVRGVCRADLSPYNPPANQNAEEDAAGSLVLAVVAFVPVEVVCGVVFCMILGHS